MIVLASHGTQGARVAEDAAFEMASHEEADIMHLYVVPDFWQGMRGDDWLNNTITQKRFGEYLENELAREAAEEITRLDKKANTLKVKIKHRAMFGKPADCLIRVCKEEGGDLAIIGTPRKKGEAGYNSRMKLEQLARSLTARLMIVPRKA